MARGRHFRGDFVAALLGVTQDELVAFGVDDQLAAAFEAAEKDFVGERRFDVLVDHPGKWPGTEVFVETLLGQQLAAGRAELDFYRLLLELTAHFGDEFVDDLVHHLGRKRVELQLAVEAVAEFRAEGLFVGFFAAGFDILRLSPKPTA